MSNPRGDVENAALAWLTRVNDPAFDSWDAWEAWLAQDPRHAEVYWRMAEDEAGIVEALATRPVTRPSAARPVARSPAANTSRRPVFSRRWVPLAAAAAAAVVVFGGLWSAWLERPQTWSVETTPGQGRSLVLADGSEMHLDGATRVTLDRARPRHAVLDRGRVLVEVLHDERRPFSIAVGDAVLTDLGTAFDVTRLNDGLRVAVSEGVVRVDVERQAVTLRAGEGLEASDGRILRRRVTPDEVGAWRGGRLVYRDERLVVVAQDLTRALGLSVTVAPEIADRRFTGSLSASGPGEPTRARLELVLGVRIVDDGAGWRLRPRPAA